MPDSTTGEASSRVEIVLYRAVGRDEAADIETHGFRLGPNTMLGKWFATTHEHAVRWGAEVPRSPTPTTEPYVIVSVRIPVEAVADAYYNPMLDGIGPAYFVYEAQLPMLNAVGAITMSRGMYYP
jgi:hypothetical protein